MTMRRAIGLMSGTSLDGVDVALIETDGETIRVERSPNGYLEPLGPTGYRAYSDDDRTLLRQALAPLEDEDIGLRLSNEFGYVVSTRP